MTEKNPILKHIFEYANERFGDTPEYLWNKFPDYAVLRNKNNSKWYAVIMNIPKNRLNIKEDGNADIIDVKCSPLIIGTLLDKEGFFPAYHMNKENWITIILDGTVSENEIYSLIDVSYEITKNKKQVKYK